MQIKVENHSVQNITNFYLPQSIAPQGVLIVRKDADVGDTLANRILNVGNIERCLITPSTISVKFITEMPEETKLCVMAEIDDFMQEMSTVALGNNEVSDQEQAEALADAFIRPTLNRDNGDIVIHDIKDHVLELSFIGHCAGCPYAQNTLQNVVMHAFKQYMPQIWDVHLKEN